MPALRRNNDLALAAGIEQLFMEHPRIVEHDLVPADEQQRRRQARQIAEQRRAEGIFRVVCIAGGIELQQFRRHGGIDVAVVNIGLTGACEVCPRRNADQTARKRQAQLLQPQAKRVNKSSASGLAAEQNLACGISLGEQILIADNCVVQRGRKAILRGQTVGCAEYTHTALV